jgi:CheY-like chemotaxis protein
LILDDQIPGPSGAQVAKTLSASSPGRAKIVMHSGTSEAEIRQTFEGYDRFFRKPSGPKALLDAIAALLEVERRRCMR